MIRNLSIGLFFLTLLMVFLFFSMRNEKEKLNTTPPFERDYLSAPVTLIPRQEIPYRGPLNDLKSIDGKIFGKHFDKQLIVCLDESGKEIRSWGKKDSLTSRFEFIIAYHKDENGVTVIDGKQGRICRLDNDDSLIYERPLPYKAIRAAWLEGSTFVVKSPDPLNKDNECYYKLNVETLTSERLDYPLPDYPHGDFTMDGYFDNSGKYNFHVCYKTGYFFSFSKDGRFMYGSKTIDKTDPPIVMVSANQAKRYHPLTDEVTRSSFSDNGILCILSEKQAVNDQKKNDVIDCYNVTDGSYRYSLSVPYYKDQSIRYIFRSENGFRAKYKDHIIEYAYDTKTTHQ